MQVNGWRDSGQHFTVTRSGLVLEGRNGSLAAAQHGRVVHGAHAGDDEANQTCWGIENEGTYIQGAMPEAQWKSLVNLCAWLCFWGKVQSASICGHREYKATQCPGDWLFGQLPDLRFQVHMAKAALMQRDS